MFCCFSFCSILNICETLVCRPLAVFWAECSSSGECQYIQSRLPVNRETFSISSRKIWQRGALSLWAELRNSNFAPLPHLFPSLPHLFPPAGSWAALNRRNDPHSEFRAEGEGGRNSEGEGARAGIICVDIVDRDKRVAEEVPEAFCWNEILQSKII